MKIGQLTSKITRVTTLKRHG